MIADKNAITWIVFPAHIRWLLGGRHDDELTLFNVTLVPMTYLGHNTTYETHIIPQ
jgi:hypothetical protein